MSKVLFILYVADQERSMDFYSAVLGDEPVLHVPGMTEFSLTDSSSLGLMPERGIKSLLGEPFPDPAEGSGCPRAELYLLVDDPEAYHARAIENGGRELSSFAKRPWGDMVAYSLDIDGHVLAFASPAPASS